MFYIKLRDITEREAMATWLRQNGIIAPFHYVPLHSAQAGLAFGRFHGEDRHTTVESERLLQLPLFYGLTEGQQARVIERVQAFWQKS